jgi:hypothetical protein
LTSDSGPATPSRTGVGLGVGLGVSASSSFDRARSRFDFVEVFDPDSDSRPSFESSDPGLEAGVSTPEDLWALRFAAVCSPSDFLWCFGVGLGRSSESSKNVFLAPISSLLRVWCTLLSAASSAREGENAVHQSSVITPILLITF